MSSPQNNLTLSIDVGSSSVRAMIFDRAGHDLENVFVQEKYEPDLTADGGVSIDPQRMCDMICACIDEALKQAGDQAARIDHVGMDTLVGNLLGIDAQGRPTTPIYTWADTRGGELGDRLRQTIDVQDYTRRTGCRIHTSYWPLRLLWLHEHHAELCQKTTHWLSLGEYFLQQLFGERRISYSTASWSGLLNRHELQWDEKTLAALPIKSDQLSTIANEPFQGLSGKWAERWPALKAARWSPSIGDGVASNVGAGCIDTKHVAISIGTSGAMRVLVPGTPEQTPDGLFVYRLDENRSLVGGALSNAGNLYGWLTRVLATDEEALKQINAMQPDSHGLTILPFLAGERAPGWNDRAQAVFMGMNFDTTPAEMVRAALESVSYRFYQVAQRLRPLLPDDIVYIASGAPVLNSPVWMQILADVLGAPVYANAEPEATIRGTAFLATGVDPEPHVGDVYKPDMERHTIYQAAVERQKALYKQVLG